jgi:hypothetical protein
MARARFARCVFLPYSGRASAPPGAVVHDVSSYADFPLCTLSPLWAHGGIPVPGWPGQVSDSVEGIWQGLKVIRGKTAPHLFRGRGQKRGGKPAGHRYGDRLLGLAEARQKIYIPAYEWALENRVDPAVLEGFLATARRGTAQFFHDLSDNADINDPDEGLAHAAVLVRYLNRRLGAGGTSPPNPLP